MGYGSYSAKDWAKLKASKKLSNNQNVEEVFKNTKCNPKMDPKFIATRECFDSKDHPNTNPIVVGLDVTGSMGYLAVKIATEALNDLITKLYSTGTIEDPALMCAAYGDYQDDSPLQVTQFESDIRIAEQLLEIYFEGCGSGDVSPFLLWEFLARHTNIDAIKKRNTKGYLFTIGDCAEIRKDEISATVKKYIGDNIPGATRESLLEEVSQSFNVFHIMIGYETSANSDILTGHKIFITADEIDSIPEIIISTIQCHKGMKTDKIIEQWDKIKQPTIKNAINQLSIFNDEQSVNL